MTVAVAAEGETVEGDVPGEGHGPGHPMSWVTSLSGTISGMLAVAMVASAESLSLRQAVARTAGERGVLGFRRSRHGAAADAGSLAPRQHEVRLRGRFLHQNGSEWRSACAEGALMQGNPGNGRVFDPAITATPRSM